MSHNIVTDEISTNFGEILDNIYLIKVNADCIYANAGEWVLAFGDKGHFMKWDFDPVSNKEEMSIHVNYTRNFNSKLKMNPEDGWSLMRAIIESGKYDGEEYVGTWLAHHISEFLDNKGYFYND